MVNVLPKKYLPVVYIYITLLVKKKKETILRIITEGIYTYIYMKKDIFDSIFNNICSQKNNKKKKLTTISS